MKYTEAQLLHQEELSESRKRIQKRKQRTRRLIQFGAIAEALLPGSDKLSRKNFKSSCLLCFPRQGAAISQREMRT